MASTASTATPAARNGQGRRVTRRAQRANTARDAWWSVSKRSCTPGTRRRSILSPNRPSNAGSRVTTTSTATTTASDRVSGEQRHQGYADERQTQDHDQHGQPGEDDRLARGGHGPGDSLVDGHPLGEVLAVTGHDEQHVVDADCDADRRCRNQQATEVTSVNPPRSRMSRNQCRPTKEVSIGNAITTTGPNLDREDHDGDAPTDQLRGPGLFGSEAFHHRAAICTDVESCGTSRSIGRGERRDLRCRPRAPSWCRRSRRRRCARHPIPGTPPRARTGR